MSLCNLLRVPPIFIMDELFKTSFGFPDLADIVFPENNDFVNSTLSQIEISESAQYYKAIFLSFIKIIVSCLSKFNKFSKINHNRYIIVNSILFYFSSILFIIVFICSTCQILIPSILSCSFCWYCTSFLLGEHTNTESHLRKIRKL